MAEGDSDRRGGAEEGREMEPFNIIFAAKWSGGKRSIQQWAWLLCKGLLALPVRAACCCARLKAVAAPPC